MTEELPRNMDEDQPNFINFSAVSVLTQHQPLVLTTLGKNVRMKLPPILLENRTTYIREWKNGVRDGKGTQN